MTTPDQATMLAVLGADFATADVDGAVIYGDSANFEAGKGRVRFGAAKIHKSKQKKSFIQEAQIVWYRGGNLINPAGKVIGRNPDNTLCPGDDVAYVVNFQWALAGAHFKAWGLAIMKRLAVLRGSDPNAITANMIGSTQCAQIMGGGMQDGLEIDFTAIMTPTKGDPARNIPPGVFTKVTFIGDREEAPPPMVNVTPQAPVTLAVPVAVAAGVVDPLGALMAGAIDVTPAGVAAPATVDPLAALMATGTPAPATVDPLAALMATQAAPAAPTRDQKIARCRTIARFANLDFTKVGDTTLDAAFAALPS